MGTSQSTEQELAALEQEIISQLDAASASPDSEKPDAAPAEGDQPEAEQPAAEPTDEANPQPEETDAEHLTKKQSPRAEKRYQEMARKNKALETRLADLERRISTPLSAASPAETPPPAPPVPAPVSFKPPWMADEPAPAAEEGSDTLSMEEMQAMIEDKVEQKYARQKATETFQSDVSTIEEKWPQFRPGTDDEPNPEYNDRLVNLVKRQYLAERDAVLKANDGKPTREWLPFPRIKDVTDEIMSLYEEAGQRVKDRTSQAIRRQSASQAAPPSATKPGGKKELMPEDLDGMSLEEMERLLPHA